MALRDWAVALRRDLAEEKLPAGLLDYLAAAPDLSRLQEPARALEQALAAHQRVLSELTALLQWQDALRFGREGSLADEAFATQNALLHQWQTRPDELHAVVAWNILADRLQQEGLQEIINLSLQWPQAGQYLTAAFRQTWLEALLEKAYEERPALRLFDRAGHEETIHKFRHLDRSQLSPADGTLLQSACTCHGPRHWIR